MCVQRRPLPGLVDLLCRGERRDGEESRARPAAIAAMTPSASEVVAPPAVRAGRGGAPRSGG